MKLSWDKKPTLKQGFQFSLKQANLFVQGYVKGESLCSLLDIRSKTFPIPKGITSKGGATKTGQRHKPNRRTNRGKEKKQT